MTSFSAGRALLIASTTALLSSGCVDEFRDSPLDPLAGRPADPRLSVAVVPAFPTEPADFTRITSRPFSAEASSPTSGVEGWEGSEARSAHFSIVTDPDAPTSPSEVAQTVLPAGLAAGKSVVVAHGHSFTDYGFQSLFTSVTVKLSDNFVSHKSGLTTLGFVSTDERSMSFGVVGAGAGPYNFVVQIPGNRPHEYLGPSQGGNQAELVRGAWYKVDFLLTGGTVAPNGKRGADGSLDVWINGVHTHRYTGLSILAHRTSAFSRVAWAPLWGTTGGGVHEAMSISLDHFYASGGRPTRAPRIVSLQIEPNDIQIEEDGTAPLATIGRDVLGNSVAVAATQWTSSNQAVATVSSTGIVQARKLGRTVVTGFAGGLRATAAVEVIPVGKPGENEPSDMKMITDRPFNTKAATDSDRGGASCVGGSECWDGVEYRSAWSIVPDPSAPTNDKRVAQQRYPAGFGGGSSPQGEAQIAWPTSDRYRTIYHRFWLKLSDNFSGHMTGTNKIFHMWAPTGNILYYSANGVRNAPLQFTVRLQGIPDDMRVYPPNVTGRTGTVITRGRWELFEVVLTLNTPGQKDGSFKVWQDGRLTHDYFGRELLPAETANPYWWQAQWSPTWGGGGDNVPQEMFMSIDQVYISGRR